MSLTPTEFDISQLDDELVLEFLQSDQDFFARHPQLLTSLQLQDNRRGTISLVERQQQLLRQKVQLLEEEITQLLTVANQNDRLLTIFNDLYLNLIGADTFAGFCDYLQETTKRLLELSDVRLVLYKSQISKHCSSQNRTNTANTELSHQILIDDIQPLQYSDQFGDDNYYFGRLTAAQQSLLFPDEASGSSCLVRLQHQDQDIGFIAFYAKDVEHFYPGIDTLLLEQFRHLVAKLVMTKFNSSD
ncbi:DUF484 family protein [Thalassotalea litorea]|uniref:DUF484 family protein n=1 Tax=Thalassotalea litorea TaxID=2020715 RepID=A0A5R9IGK6_9GAMM|nr:DUF484 family protein [Thalassotalea litorea]TLU64655.1 DUF484 family protein [Thalassotalea litorea]